MSAYIAEPLSIDAEPDQTMIDCRRVGQRCVVKVSRGNEVLHIHKLDVANSKQRDEFVYSMAQKHPEVSSVEIRKVLLAEAAKATEPVEEYGKDDLQGAALDLANLEPWLEPVDGATLLITVSDTFTKYLALPDGAADAMALWVAHAHCHDCFECSPRLNVTSPDKGCGKTTARDVLATLVPRPLSMENLTTPVLFRVIAQYRPTVLADEYDAWIRENEELRGILNAGHRRGGQALRCEGDNFEVRAFAVYSPAVLVGIGNLPGTLHDRSIVIRLSRAKPGEIGRRFDSRNIEAESNLCRKLARWAQDNTAALKVCDPDLPPGAANRLADNWRPLFAIAEVVGGGWPLRTLAAYQKLTNTADEDAQGIGASLLGDIKAIFGDCSDERVFSATLVEKLLTLDTRPWPEANRGRPISASWLAKKLKAFGICPRQIRGGSSVVRGYFLQDFSDAFSRYLSTPGFASATNPINTGVSPIFTSATSTNGVAPAKVSKQAIDAGCSAVALANPLQGDEPPLELEIATAEASLWEQNNTEKDVAGGMEL